MQIMALYIFFKSEGGQMISAISSKVLAKLHLGFESRDKRSDKHRKAVLGVSSEKSF